MSLASLPAPNTRRVAIHLKPAAERAVKQGHPWVFDQGITRKSHDGATGDLAVLYDHRNRFLGVGLYDAESPIRVKVLQSGQPADINTDWFAQTLREALALRDPLRNTDTTGYRLVNGESDSLPALIVDRYADTLVIKVYSLAWMPHLRSLLSALDEVYRAQRWVLRLARTVGAPHGLKDGMILKGSVPAGPVEFLENGLLFSADVQRGHKTGFFFDQRDNRALAGSLAAGRSVLDVFAYTGAFALYCAQGGATSVLGVDISEPALAIARQAFNTNVRAGRIVHTTFDTQAADAFRAMSLMIRQRRRYEMVIIDPPSFAKSEAEVPGALRAYTQLAELGLQLLADNGVFVMASCSSRVRTEQFFDTIDILVQRLRPDLEELHRTGHAVDHPATFPEAVYLKCWFGGRL
jgi:23S rRNA (cytosine1962-C5)-methyltransferase